MAQDNNPYVAIPTLAKEAGIFTEDEDKRIMIQTKDTPDFFHRIGQLRMDFETNNKTVSYNGTASVFAVDKTTKKAYAVTCAHNLVIYDPLKNTPNYCTAVTFERRKTIAKGSSKSIKEYKVSDKWIHPDYDPSKAVDSNDLAIIDFYDDDEYFKDLQESMNGLDDRFKKEDYTHIYGYPVDKKGELWGQSKPADITLNNESNLLQYDIQTTGGQSGSPIIKFTTNTQKIEQISEKIFGWVLMGVFVFMIYVGNWLGFQSGSTFDLAVLLVIITFIGIIYGENKLNIKIIPNETIVKNTKQCNIIGIHTTGQSTGDNIGVKLSDKSLAWIKEQVKMEKATQDSADDDSFYCLKNTPFL